MFSFLVCGGKIYQNYWTETRTAVIKSPAYPNYYPNDAHCTYEIIARYGNIHLKFTSFDLEKSDGCKKDWVKIYEGSISNKTLVQTRCGNDTTPYFSNSLKVFMVFHSAVAVANKGFVAEYKSEYLSYRHVPGEP